MENDTQSASAQEHSISTIDIERLTIDELIALVRGRLSENGPIVDPVALRKFVRGDEELSPMLRRGVAEAICEEKRWFEAFLKMVAQAQQDVDPV